MIRIAVVEDQTLMRSALISLLDLEDDITVVGEAGRGDEVVELVRELRPDVILLDIELPGMSGLEALEELSRSADGTTSNGNIADSTDPAVIIVTTFGRAGYLRRAMDAGARGFLVKDDPVETLAESIRRVAQGETVIDPLLAAQALSSGENPLSEREAQVLIASDDGTPIADAAETLHLSPSTVRNYLSSAIGKLGARNRAEALRNARREGWI
ncbi:response regulator transcription factor [Brevibacterium spongiae]|uniref:Response regulator transcription factor n=1 Tax=Brevibacterium spongiae TaxID=2909672 RepID=A0ABY5SLS6_9MICO|nr:response regulator transcription factor [Brevibacterium spongiae]UVI35230.1 response regulator transcription factor [Brevibacterium spongiae]